MFYKTENGNFTGFYEDEDKDGNYTEISIEDWQNILDKQSEGEVIFYNSKSKKLKARHDSLLAGITSTYVKLTQLATESLAGIIKISTTAQVSAGTDDTTAVSPYKLREVFANSKVRNGYQKLANGTIIQWGAAVYTAPGNAIGTYSSITNNFPITFPNKVLSIVITGFIETSDDGSECLHSVEWSSNSAFAFRATRLVGSTQPGNQGSVYYIAIGY